MGSRYLALCLTLACGRTGPVEPLPAPVPRPPAAGAALTAVQISAGWGTSCALVSDGTVACWGGWTKEPWKRPFAERRAGLADVIEVKLGGSHGCAVSDGGTMRCWGQGGEGQLGDGWRVDRPEAADVKLAGVRRIALGNRHTCAVLDDGTVHCWGRCDLGQLGTGNNQSPCDANKPSGSVVGQLEGAVEVSANGNGSCALTAAGEARCWGGYSYAEGGLDFGWVASPVPGFETPVRQVSAGWHYGCALMPSGRVRCVGTNDDYSREPPPPRVFPAAEVPGIEGAVEVGAGMGHACARLGDGTVRCWGANRYGELGDGTLTDSDAPVTVRDLSGVVELAVGHWHNCARRQSGEVRCWGRNDQGCLGNGSTAVNESVPVMVRWSASP